MQEGKSVAVTAKADGAQKIYWMVYQVEEWDAAHGAASIWVRIPLIKGNARKEIKMHWGNGDA